MSRKPGRRILPTRLFCLDRYNILLGGDLNEPMVLGTLGAVKPGLRARGVPHGRGGVEAALDSLAA